MKLLSCDGCGLVYDQDKIEIPDLDKYYDEDNEKDITEVADWNGDTYVPFFLCICGDKVSFENE